MSIHDELEKFQAGDRPKRLSVLVAGGASRLLFRPEKDGGVSQEAEG